MDMKKVGPAGLATHVASRLLDLLSTDDAFRALFVSDPKAALEVAGYEVPQDAGQNFAHPAGCLLVTSLASKADIQQARQRLQETLEGIFGFGAPRELGGC